MPIQIDNETTTHRYRSVIATIVTLLVLTAIAVFSWRILHYMQLINSGKISAAELSFDDQQTMATRLANAPVPEGEFDVSDGNNPSLGSADAPVHIVEFADFGCPYSRQSSFVIRALAHKYGDKIQYTYRDFPITELHPQAQQAALAGECARDQEAFWQYHDKLYLNQGNLERTHLVRYAKELNLNIDQFEGCLDSEKYKERVEADYQAGFEAGVRGTPTFFINGVRIPGSIPEDVFDVLIQRFLEES